jgi:ATP-dependent protease HslVU (ClpYQ) peptidase subunit
VTAIVAFIYRGKVLMGGDSADVCVESQNLQLRATAKVFKRNNMLIGTCGAWRVNEELMHKPMPMYDSEYDPHYWLVTEFLPWLRISVDKASLEHSEILVGLQGRVFHIYAAEQVAEAQSDYEACGSGAQIARGAFYALEETGFDITPSHRVEIALEAAERFCSGVRGPFTIIEED